MRGTFSRISQILVYVFLMFNVNILRINKKCFVFKTGLNFERFFLLPLTCSNCIFQHNEVIAMNEVI